MVRTKTKITASKQNKSANFKTVVGGRIEKFVNSRMDPKLKLQAILLRISRKLHKFPYFQLINEVLSELLNAEQEIEIEAFEVLHQASKVFLKNLLRSLD